MNKRKIKIKQKCGKKYATHKNTYHNKLKYNTNINIPFFGCLFVKNVDFSLISFVLDS